MVRNVRFMYSGIRVRNLERSIRFYERIGFRVSRSGWFSHGGKWVHLVFPGSDHRLELNYYPKGSPYATPFSPGEGLDHIGVRVNDMAAAGRQLKAAGGRLVDQFKEGRTVVVAYYEGPDGIWVELILSPSV